MKTITMREFAELCTQDPTIRRQVLEIPKTISPEKVLDLASRNGFQIVPEELSQQERALPDEALEAVNGGLREAELDPQTRDWLTWLHIWTGVSELRNKPGR